MRKDKKREKGAVRQKNIINDRVNIKVIEAISITEIGVFKCFLHFME